MRSRPNLCSTLRLDHVCVELGLPVADYLGLVATTSQSAVAGPDGRARLFDALGPELADVGCAPQLSGGDVGEALPNQATVSNVVESTSPPPPSKVMLSGVSAKITVGGAPRDGLNFAIQCSSRARMCGPPAQTSPCMM